MKKGFTTIEFIIILVIIAIIAAVGIGAVIKAKPNRDLYNVWMKINPQHRELTLEEWNMLRVADLLPGQSKTKTDVIYIPH